jgi:adenylate kinase
MLTGASYMNSIIFVGGIHGAGKTTVSRLVATAILASHVTAGALIRETAAPDHQVGVGFGDKAVPDVDANQALLLRGLDLYRARIGSGAILLDGHFVLLNPNGSITRIPADTYKVIAPRALLLVETDLPLVRERLIKRDGDAPPMDKISLLAESERSSAELVSAQLRVPMWIVRGDGDPAAAAAIAASHVRGILAGAV